MRPSNCFHINVNVNIYICLDLLNVGLICSPNSQACIHIHLAGDTWALCNDWKIVWRKKTQNKLFIFQALGTFICMHIVFGGGLLAAEVELR